MLCVVLVDELLQKDLARDLLEDLQVCLLSGHEVPFIVHLHLDYVDSSLILVAHDKIGPDQFKV